MSTENTPAPSNRPSLVRNWVSLTGLVIVIGSIFSFFLLMLLDVMAHFSNPYMGILTWLVAPMFFFGGILLTAIGALHERKKLGESTGLLPKVVVDLSRPRDRRRMAYFLGGAVVFLLVSSVGSYQTYHFTESVQFCGEACHTVMQPELVTYRNGAHARVDCVECHIGAGATWYVKSKLSGAYQVYATAFDKFPRPIPTPIRNLRPAQETCEQCHWPKKFVGNVERTYVSYLGEENNPPFTLRMLLHVGGGDPTHGLVGGIHWHMNVGFKIDYLPTDASRQKIPWVRVTDSQGVVTIFHTPGFTNKVDESQLRRMDCMDCHNRPAHRYETPSEAVSLAMSLGHIDRNLPWVKTNAIYALTQKYSDDVQGMQHIATILAERYPADKFPKLQDSLRQAITSVQSIYTNNFFPRMNANWAAYPENIGHKNWPGCFRCHDGEHKTSDGKRSIKANDCNACHTILAQGSGEELNTLTPGGQPFKHPGGEVEGACNDCHDGTL